MNALTRCTLLPLLWLCATQVYAFQSTPPEQLFSTKQSVNSEQHIQEYSYSDKHEPLQTTPLGAVMLARFRDVITLRNRITIFTRMSEGHVY